MGIYNLNIIPTYVDGQFLGGDSQIYFLSMQLSILEIILILFFNIHYFGRIEKNLFI
jgi:hypothetical protein